MRYLLTTLCILFFVIMSPSYGHAQNTQNEQMIAEVQEIALWAEDYFTILNDMMLLFNNPEVNGAIAAIESDDREAIHKATQKYGENRRIILARIERAKDNMAEVPELKAMKKSQGKRVVKLVSALNTQLELLPTMYDEIAVASGHLETLLNRISKGDYSGVSEIAKQQNLALIRFMKAENLQVEAALVALEKDNPNYAFQSIVMAQNNITIEELTMDNLSMDSDITLSDRQDFNKRIKAELDKIPPLLTHGRAAEKKMVSNMKATIPHMKTEQEITFVKSIVSAVNTFSDSFNVEKEMYDLALNSYGLYASNKSSWDIEDAIEENDQKIIVLAHKRSDLIDKRVSIIKR